ncbi:DUF29 domain-containing protein [Pleurocapsales cyanobacterium LEGE 06147]|nr:DUF29 domain-containing protein [Pleurocapsales cyanobacterium LEGE 06147]
MNTPSPKTSVKSSSSLYEEDYYRWIETTVNQLREGRLAEVDLANLSEELEDMGKSQKHAIKSNLRVVLMHLLKYKYQPDKRANSWKYTITEHRIRLEDDFSDSPSLKRYFSEVFDESYQKARKLAATETGLPLETFPPESPFTQQQALNSDYLPE